MRWATLWGCALLWVASPAVADDAMCRALAGATIVNADGEYLGALSPANDGDSIFNPFGKFGNKHDPASIWNPHGKNGDSHRRGSAFNPYTTSAPKLMKNERLVGYLSVNKDLGGAANPVILGALCNGFKPRP